MQGHATLVASEQEVGPEVVFGEGQPAQGKRIQPAAPRARSIVRQNCETVAVAPARDHLMHASLGHRVPSRRRIHGQKPSILWVCVTMGLHDRNRLLQFAQARHVKPHPRPLAGTKHVGVAFVTNGHPGAGTGMAQHATQTQNGNPRQASDRKPPQRPPVRTPCHQCQYSFASRLYNWNTHPSSTPHHVSRV